MPPMCRPVRLVTLIAAAALHLAAPLASYARGMQLSGFGDICSAQRPPAREAPWRGTPAPAPAHRHCALSPCCTGGAAGAIAPPPPVAVSPFIPFAGVLLPAPAGADASAAIVAAASPRGPPSRF
jgi:hypothetical protein